MTARTFVANPFGPAGSRLYKSGDLAKQAEDGTIEFLGRVDHQLKLRGFRIEPGEVEASLLRHPQVREAVVAAREVTPGSTALVAYVIPAAERPSAEELRAQLAAQLPPHLVPGHFVLLDALPLTPNGKLDRAGLPLPQRRPQDAARASAAPRTSLEATIAGAFETVLGLEQIDAEANFFDLGGDSFSAVRAVRHIPGASVALLFQNPAVRSLAAALRQGAKPDPAGRLLRLTPEREQAKHTLVCVPYGGGNAVAYYPLARALSPEFAVYGVTLPGHDLGYDEPFETLEATADACAAQLGRELPGPVVIYGHCIGVALAVELALRLEEAGQPVERVFLGGSYPFPRKSVLGMDLAKVIPERRQSDERLMRYLQSLGGFEEVVDAAELGFIMRAFRNDGAGARRYFTARYQAGRSVRLRAPITFVAGADDPETPRYERRYGEWREYSDSVDLSVVPGGGHYFLKNQAATLAEIIKLRLQQADS